MNAANVSYNEAQANKASPIDGALSDLKLSLDRAEHLIGVLASKIGPVLTPPPLRPNSEPGTAIGAVPPATSPIQNQIQQMAVFAREQNDRLQELIDRATT